MDRDETQTRGRRIAESLLIYLPGLAVAMSAILKFAGVPSLFIKWQRPASLTAS